VTKSKGQYERSNTQEGMEQDMKEDRKESSGVKRAAARREQAHDE
jgi:hypothetical protein